MRVLVTCPPMLGAKDQFIPYMESKGLNAVCPDVVQTIPESQLCEIIHEYDGWIIGDDLASRKVFESGKRGKLKAAVKWGIGTDNVDLNAAKDLNIPVINTPNMFGAEVADIALGYVIALARETFFIDRGVRDNKWPKNTGVSLGGKSVAVIGYGDIGSNVAFRLNAIGMDVRVYDPAVETTNTDYILNSWPNSLGDCDFIVFTCGLNQHNFHMFNETIIDQCKAGVRIVNVARGPLIDEAALCKALKSGKVHSAALDVFENEPLPLNSYLREHPLCIFGSHNSSNTIDAVYKTNIKAIDKLAEFLGN